MPSMSRYRGMLGWKAAGTGLFGACSRLVRGCLYIVEKRMSERILEVGLTCGDI